MKVTYDCCAGLDVHKKTVVACCLSVDASGQARRETRTHGTTTAELLSMSEWMTTQAITHIAMENTGEYWKPVYNVLESSYEVMVVNSHHFKQVPGRKTDVKDAEWLAELLSYGLVRGSLIPPLPQRDLRDLTRQRTTLIRERASVINRLQKVLEWANIKLASVVTDISGVSARRMLKAMVEGSNNPEALAALAKGRLGRKQAELAAALTGQVREHHRFLLQTHLEHLEFLEQQIGQFDQHIACLIQEQSLPEQMSATPGTAEALSWEQAMALLDTIPGVARQSAELLLAEVGVDMSRFQECCSSVQMGGSLSWEL